MAKIITKDSQGEVNGWVLPIWNSAEGPVIDQVYLTVIFPGKTKGPHLHLKRRGRFKCIRGSVVLVIRNRYNVYVSTVLDVNSDPVTVQPGTPAALYNPHSGLLDDAYVLNMPFPRWTEDDQDEHVVANWNWRYNDTD